ncbi:glycosyltransferase family A protein [Liquorilactobacillus mali]|uniref:Beta-glycosyltransferase n=1 Tax=Liquorilactobacillus mali TaxID=1618 RepID=A0A0R2FXI9_9LACO|nr:glycosyltransferase family 2 protein [Liquorilactobacillus mali]KRN33105.1 beta-glycosyltransferase [Liquorilactobacillus mali]
MSDGDFLDLFGIVTTVYNRREKLKLLYKSLIQQSRKDFHWIIVDDGSTENVEKMVKSWIKENKIKIIFTRQKNMGKMNALNNALKNLVDFKWFLVVDNDDILGKNAIEIVINDIEEIEKKDRNFAGVIYPRYSENYDKKELKKWDKVDSEINIMDLKYVYNIKESAIILNVKFVAQELPKLLSNSEKFLSEEILYNNLAKYGKFIVKNKLFYYFNYLNDGLTNNLVKNWKKNFRNSVLLFQSRYYSVADISFQKRVIERIKTIMNLNALCISTKNNFFKPSPNKVLSLLLLIPSFLYYLVKFRN